MIKRIGNYKEWLTPVSQFAYLNILALTYNAPWFIIIENPDNDEDYNYCIEFSKPYKVNVFPINNLLNIEWEIIEGKVLILIPVKSAG